MEQPQGIVCSLERFATHDGPGIRTLVYMKGCPLTCVWCSSPHTQSKLPDLLYTSSCCIGSDDCIAICPEKALQRSAGEPLQIDRDLCNACGICVEACTSRALEISGQSMTVDELFREVDKDSSFYRRSNGGVTVGGGELAMQPEFVSAFLKKCKEQYIHTAIETCGLAPWIGLESILQYVDLLHFDIKHMADKVHRELTGASNRQILENARKASKMCTMIIRIPVVPGCNDTEENIIATAKFAASLEGQVQRIELLPYHQLGMHRYTQLGKTYQLDDVETPDESHMERLKYIVMSAGVDAEIVS